MEIQHFSHNHTLSFVEVGEETDAVRCYGCGRFFQGPAYTCKKCPEFFIHKSCVELPHEIKNHAFHQNHPLKLYPVDSFVCDGCGELCGSLVYRCGLCMFSLDVKCATLNQELAKTMAQKGKEIKITINHFSHNHPLTRCIYLMPKIRETDEFPCMACKQGVHGKLVYACQSCIFILHESCADNMPEQTESSFHPEHTLLAQPLGGDTPVPCGGCGDGVYGISFSCSKCNFNFHVSCAKYQTRAMKLHCHVHPLLLLGESNIRSTKKYISCNECGEYCNEAFLSCRKCDFHIHLECVPLPSAVKHTRHIHLLTLAKSVVEDDSDDYYCDMCEAKRNPEHHAFICGECKYIAHVECVISEVEPPERISSYLVPRPRKEKAETGGKMGDKLLEGEGMKPRKAEQGDSSMKSDLDKIDGEAQEIVEQIENLQKRYMELGKKRQEIAKSLLDEYLLGEENRDIFWKNSKITVSYILPINKGLPKMLGGLKLLDGRNLWIPTYAVLPNVGI